MCVQTHVQPDDALQLLQLDDAAHQQGAGRRGSDDEGAGRADARRRQARCSAAPGEGRRHPLPVCRRPEGLLRLRGPQSRYRSRPARGPRGPLRIRQDDAHEAAAEALGNLMHGRTSIVVAHRLSTVAASTASSCLLAAGSWRMARTQSLCRKAARTQSSGSARPAASSRRNESAPVFQLSRARMRPCVLSPRISPDETAAHARGALLPRQRPERRRTAASRLTRLIGSPQSSSTGGRSALQRKPMPCP